MAEMMSVKDAAMLWGISERRVSLLCRDGRIPGAHKNGRVWEIPVKSKKPADSRIKTGRYIKGGSVRLPLPIGISDYRLASSEYYYIDKTLLIKEFLDERPMVSLFTRPRRFGKTLNMDMLRTYFEKTKEDTSVFFKNRKIWNCGERYRSYQGKYPVIFITFKDVKKNTWEETFDHIVQIITEEYKRHTELASSQKVTDKDYYARLVAGQCDMRLFDSSLGILTKMLHEHYGEAPVIIIDEYDTPIQQGHLMGFYDDVILFMRNLLSGCLKDNRHLSFGFLTGILRVAKESIFSGLNNLTVNSVLDQKYSRYFGFTSDEVMEMARYYNAEERFAEICEWYDGYRFGDTEIFNPWSVINYFRNDCRPGAYWQSTGSNEIIGEVLSDADTDIYDKLQTLLQGGRITVSIDTSVIYPQVRSDPSSVFSFLLVAGYLKAVSSDVSFSGDYMCDVQLPNKEISFVYRKEILRKLSNIIPQYTVSGIHEALYSGNTLELKKGLQRLLMRSVSCYDTAGENFYHGLMLGLCALLDQYYTLSNRESGLGRYDLMLIPQKSSLPAVIIEIKAEKNCSQEKLIELSKSALAQILQKKYDTELSETGYTEIIRYGVAFSGKSVEIAVG